MPYKNVQYVIFDIDGLLLDTEKLYEEIIDEVCQHFGGKYTEILRQKILGRKEQDTATILIKELNLSCSEDEFSAYYQASYVKGLEAAELMPGAEKLIKHLSAHKIPIACATSSSSLSIPAKTKNHQELFKLMNHVVSGTSDPEVKEGKPSPDIFLICAARFPDKPKPDQCLVFEDAPSGVQAAYAAGMQCVMVPDPRIPDDDRKLATLVLKSLEDFVPEEFGLPPYKN
ncbi:pseudouridine-5'-phosphatase-like [Chrysoperla carnea]|uniref:pseudouridine-5'-phosphatase-like n=1 Tax=Chrysoperla carnea TaxID=189513 RepID=UPI001D08F609|nr:pseudouridine-5'-phosphatase-like [Chrysoperla carnea]